MLIGNGMLIDKVPLTRLGQHWNNFVQDSLIPASTLSDGFGSNAAIPDGYYPPHAFMMARKAGNLRAMVVTGAGSVTGTMQSGYNIDATITGSGGIDNVTSIGLIVSIAAVLTASGGISSASTQALASMVATITGSGSVTATAKGLADLGAVLTGSGSVNANNTALMQIAATIRGYGDLTPEGIRDTVWNAVLANYPTAGTAGKALSTASSGGVDLNALAAAVWGYVIENGLSAEKAMRIYGAVLAGKVSGAGTGSELFTGLDGTTVRVTSTVDASGNRTSVVVNGT